MAGGDFHGANWIGRIGRSSDHNPFFPIDAGRRTRGLALIAGIALADLVAAGAVLFSVVRGSLL